MWGSRMRSVLVALLLLAAPAVQGFFTQGSPPRSYESGAEIAVLVNSLRSMTQLVPRDYYSLPFCQPQERHFAEQTFGQTLWGDVVSTSPYVVRMGENSGCRLLECPASNAAAVRADIGKLATFIEQKYRGDLSVDGVSGFSDPEGQIDFGGRCVSRETRRGYALGVPKRCSGNSTKTMISNHLDLHLKCHRPRPGIDEFHVVGFAIKPYSIAFDGAGQCTPKRSFDPAALQARRSLSTEDVASGKRTVVWSYRVMWEENTGVSWSARWDAFIAANSAPRGGSIILFHAASTALWLIFLAGSVSLILLQTHRCIKGDEDLDNWRLLHADVFRPPKNLRLLSMVVGTGAQLLLAAMTLVCGVAGFLSPANPGGSLAAPLCVLVVASPAGGFVCGTILKTFDPKWHTERRTVWRTALGCAMLGPGFALAVYFAVNGVYWGVGGTNAASAPTMCRLIGLLLCFAVPLVAVGAFAASGRAPFELPAKVDLRPHEIPPQPWYSVCFSFSDIGGGFISFLPFLAEFIYVFDSIWRGSVYTSFGVLFLMFTAWSMSVSLLPVAVVHLRFLEEDHRWWWRSVTAASGCGVPIMLLSVWFYSLFLDIESPTGTVVYFAYTTLFALAYGCAAGSVGFVTAFFYVRHIYGIKYDASAENNTHEASTAAPEGGANCEQCTLTLRAVAV